MLFYIVAHFHQKIKEFLNIKVYIIIVNVFLDISEKPKTLPKLGSCAGAKGRGPSNESLGILKSRTGQSEMKQTHLLGTGTEPAGDSSEELRLDTLKI